MPVSRRRFIRQTAAAAAGLTAARWLSPNALAQTPAAAAAPAAPPADAFQPTWDSLAQYQTPDWFRDAKFGIWAHWGPQCQPEEGDWYARRMYQPSDPIYKSHLARYGHPSKAGFKEIINEWKAESWEPEHLVDLYKKAGAKYFMALANHHDNLDLYDSTFQSWNSVAVGPKKDLVGGWAKATRAAGLRFAVSVHAARTWSWYEPTQSADKTGPLAGVPYDGKLTAADGQGQWWERLDPQELYAQNHVPSVGFDDPRHKQAGADGVGVPDKAYCEKFYNRTIELIDKYGPDLIYFDDTVLPLHPVSDVGLRIAAHFYNASLRRHAGRLEAVLTGKILNEQQRKCLVWDLERGVAQGIQPLPFQTDTCIGEWHYSKRLFERHGYKKPATVAQMLVDIVSKNGNLMLNVPLPGSGAPDTDALAFVADFARWMDRNGEGIYATRPWKVYGEGPSTQSAPALQAQGFNEGKNKPYTAEDFRFVRKGDDTLYAFALAWPENGALTIKSLAEGSPHAPGKVERVEFLGEAGTPLQTERTAEGLKVMVPAQKVGDYVYGLKIFGAGIAAAS